MSRDLCWPTSTTGEPMSPNTRANNRHSIVISQFFLKWPHTLLIWVLFLDISFDYLSLTSLHSRLTLILVMIELMMTLYHWKSTFKPRLNYFICTLIWPCKSLWLVDGPCITLSRSVSMCTGPGCHSGKPLKSRAREKRVSVDQRRLVGGAIGGWAHCNGWNGFKGTESNVVSICLMCFVTNPSSHQRPMVWTSWGLSYDSFW